jgi:hypothetical protein
MIFFVVTTCLLNDCPIRNRNTPPASQLETLVKNLNLSHFKIVVVETTAQKHISTNSPPTTPHSTYSTPKTTDSSQKTRATENCGTCTTVSTTTLSPTTISSLK